MSNQLTVMQNRHSGVLAVVNARYPNYHPVLAMVDLAHRADVMGQDPKLEFEIHKAVAPYCEARLSSVEVKPPQDPARVIVSLFEDVQLESGETVSVEVPLVRELEELVPLD